MMGYVEILFVLDTVRKMEWTEASDSRYVS